MFKKFIIILLFVFLCFISIFSLTACNSNNLNFAFVTDTHVIANDFFTEDNFSNYTSIDKMVHLSDAIFNSVADEIIKSKKKYLLMGGDLTENGDLLSHQACIATLTRLKEAGVKVFVINGNHDIAQTLNSTTKITADTFRELYSDFGYGDAMATYQGTLSYTANLNEKYRLIAIDNIPYEISETNYKEEFSKEHNAWVLSQVDKCIEDNKTPIIIGHKPLLQHFPKVTESFLDRTYYNMCKSFVKTFADKGCYYSFTGHMHMQDVKDVTSDKGNVFTDITSSSTAFFPSAYRTITFKKNKIDIATKQVQAIKKDYLSSFVSETEETAVTKNYRDFCYTHFCASVKTIASNFAKPSGILGGTASDDDMRKFMNILLPNVLGKFINNPLYIKDEDNNISLERILSTYNVSLPESSYKCIADVASFYVAALMNGDENILGCPENTIVKLAVKSIFYYLNEQSANIETALPEYDKININLDKLFDEGILECYDSNLVPVALDIIGSSINNSLLRNILGSINNNFDALKSFEAAINIYTNESLSGILTYFNGKEIRLDDLLNAIFDIYVSDLMNDVAPKDNNLTLIR